MGFPGSSRGIVVGAPWAPPPPIALAEQTAPDRDGALVVTDPIVDERLDVSAPDLLEPVIAFRSWRLGDGGLLSPETDEWWPPGTPLEARCLHQAHLEVAPVGDCHCGIYGYHDAWTKMTWQAMRPGDAVPGAMLAWGRIEASFTGLRAQFARAVCVAIPDWTRTSLRRQIYLDADRLGIQVTTIRNLASVASAYGHPTPGALRGDP